MKQIAQITSTAETIKERRNALNAEAKKWTEIRDALNLQSSTLRNEVQLLKTKRDEANQAVKRLKEQRQRIRAHITTTRQECRRVRETVDRLRRRASPDGNAVKQQLNELEWKIQTTPLSATEEQEILTRIQRLEEQSLIQKEIETREKKVADCQTELGALMIQERKIHGHILELVETSQKHHREMRARREEVQSVKTSADNAHERYRECREAADIVHGKYLEVRTQIHALSVKINEMKTAEHHKQLHEKTERMRQAAYKKWKEKKKLTFHEFKLLKEKGLI